MNRLPIVALAAVALFGGAAVSHAGPCTGQIAELEQQLARLETAPQPGGAGMPTAAQSVGAQLHHQPTAQSVERAEGQANAAAASALERARKADAEGNAGACAKAVAEAKDLYGIP